MSKMGRPRNSAGVLYHRGQSDLWWVRYRNNDGGITKESTGTANREDAERFLRDRLDARDEGKLPAMLAAQTAAEAGAEAGADIAVEDLALHLRPLEPQHAQSHA